MKKIVKFLTLLVIISGLVVFASCGPEESTGNTPSTPENPNTPNTPSTPENPNTPSTPENPSTPDVNKEDYTVTVQAMNGKPLRDFIVSFSNPFDSSVKINPKMTDGSGKATFSLNPDQYQVTIEATPGYYFEDGEQAYTTSVTKDNRDVEVTCSYELITGEEPDSSVQYSTGDQLYDFTVTTSNNQEWNLADQLEKYDLVVLNFWYTTCSWCITEFPYLQDAYADYQDKVAVLGLNNGSNGQDTVQDVIAFKQQYGLTFDLAMDKDNLAGRFNVSGYPTTVFIDRYGTADYIEPGAITSKDKWMRIFDSYLGDEYVPSYKGTGSEDEKVKPDIEMSDPDDMAALVNAEGFDGVFKPYEADDADYNWPWVIDTETQSIKTTNKGIHNSYSIFTLAVQLKKDQVFTFDYRTDCDEDDILYVLTNDRIIFSTSGVKDNYSSCYAYVAAEDGEYTFSFGFIKNEILSSGTDTIYLKNFRYTILEDVETFTPILRDCASGEFDYDRWTKYSNIVFNQEDGYYHIDSVNGPLVLADLLGQTHFSNTTIFTYFNDETFLEEQPELAKYQDLINRYASYASNSIVVNYTPVTEELADVLKLINQKIGLAPDNSQAWLEMCVYYNVYGPLDETICDPVTKQIKDPIVGLAPFNCFETVEDDSTTETVEITSLNYNRVINTRGFLFKFVPTQTGVYKIHSTGTDETNCIVMDADLKEYAYNDRNLRYYAYGEGLNDSNFITYAYFVKGETYYIKPYFEDIYHIGMMNFVTEYVGVEADVMTICSEWPFTTGEDFGDVDDIEDHLITVGIDTVLGEDGYYHQKLEDGSISESYLYVDIKNISNFGFSLTDMIDKGAYDFTKTELGHPAFDEEGYLLEYYWLYDEEGNLLSTDIQSRRKTDKNGQPIMITDAYQNKTERVRELFAEKVINEPGSQLDGCIVVDEEICQILQSLMDKYTFSGVENSWQKCCYYFKHIAAPANAE